MKKIILALLIVIFSSNLCLAKDRETTQDTKYQKKVMEVGFNILNANMLDKRVIFKYDNSKKVNAYAFARDKSVIVLRGILPYCDNDDELAAIISHEISHNMDYYDGFLKRFSIEFAPKKYEFKADKRGVDYMVKAGYDPIAMIVILNKITGEPNWWERYSSHPNGSKRLAALYEYIYNKYPAYLIDNQYKENIYYQNFLITSKDAREKVKKEHENKTK